MLINKGQDFRSALKDAAKDPEIRERHFVTPMAVSALGQAREASGAARARSRSPRRDRGGARPPVPHPAGRGRGSARGKGRDKKSAGRFGFRKDLHANTPDGRPICFAFNSPGGCKGACGRVHVCRKCLDKSHGFHEHERAKE